jgi:Ca2+/H+ antiporter, TMEM165/GDT1 family
VGAADGAPAHPLECGRLMEAFLVSVAVVALGEIGDKTQLLALILAARFRRPWPIVTGILVATLANHTLAGLVGNWMRAAVPADVLRWLVALSFFAVAAWALKPDRIDEEKTPTTHFGVFGVTVVAFFLAEMGDKTQVATIVLAARFDALAAVVIGTTLGMLVANVPVVFAGKLAAERIPFKAVRIAAALLFAALGAWVLYIGIPAP